MAGEATFEAGALLGGKYRILDLLGQGGMGAVYLAENVDIGRQVAIKVLKPELASDANSMARFRQEARAAAAIGHPGIVEVLDMGTLPDGGAFIVMERLEGETLRERLAKHGSLSPGELSDVMAAVLDTLAVAHDKGVIHRDLKPDNIFLVSQPVAVTKILDFGISKFRGTGDVALTRTGMVMGTPLYMSPEQARGSKDVGVTADIYSIGAILYEALSGQPPFPGESYNEVLAKVLMDAAPPLGQLRPDVPLPLADLIEGMLTKDPTGRPQTARDAASRLRTAAQRGTGTHPPRGLSGTHVRPGTAGTPPPSAKPAFQTGPRIEPQRPAPVANTYTPPPRGGTVRGPGALPAAALADTHARPAKPGASLPTAASPAVDAAAPVAGSNRGLMGALAGFGIAALLVAGGFGVHTMLASKVEAPLVPVDNHDADKPAVQVKGDTIKVQQGSATVEVKVPAAAATPTQAVPDAGAGVAVPAQPSQPVASAPTPVPAPAKLPAHTKPMHTIKHPPTVTKSGIQAPPGFQ